MDVITFVLTEQDVKAIGQHGLDALAVLDTYLVMKEINKYLINPKADPQVVGMIKKAYSRPLAIAEAATDRELRSALQLIETLRPFDITADIPVETLEEYSRAINKFMECSYATPYRSSVKGYSFKEAMAVVKEINPRVYQKVNKAKTIFTDTHNSGSVGTVFKRSSYNIWNLKIIQYGIEFLLESSKSYSPVAWRHL